jgi:glycosyltransferase involved in cell wall biosynthesis
MKDLSFVCPAYNEQDNINKLVNNINKISRKLLITYEILFIDDCSTDNTKKIAKSIKHKNFRYYQNSQNKGFGASFKRGINLSIGKSIMLLPGENVYELNSLKKFIKAGLNKKITISKYLNPENRHPLRNLITISIAKIINIFTRLNLDQYTGIIMINSGLAKSINFTSTKFAFQIEILIMAIFRGIEISVRPIRIKKNEMNFFTSAMTLESFIDFLIILRKIIYLFFSPKRK